MCVMKSMATVWVELLTIIVLFKRNYHLKLFEFVYYCFSGPRVEL